MVTIPRRDALKAIGALATVGGGIGTASANGTESGSAGLEKLGHSRLSDPPGGYAEASVRADGRYAVVGSFLGEGGSFLVDVSDASDPREVHRLPSAATTRNADVQFDPREGLYYRTQEKNADDGEFGVEIVDYGYADGTAAEPVITARIQAAGESHNVVPHPDPDAALLYVVNEYYDDPGLEVWDVSRPDRPRKVRNAGPLGGLHDAVVDPDDELLHCAYIHADGPAAFEGYAILDVSDPRRPEGVGRFDYADAPDYTDTVGEEGFENCHYASYDPERPYAVVGDEIGRGVPGGKHIFDISDPAAPEPVDGGFFVSPNAARMDEDHEQFDWTGHNFDVIPASAAPIDGTLLVSGDYHEGTVLYDIADVGDPTVADAYETDDGADEANGPEWLGSPPMAWDADYNDATGVVVTSDMATGIYTFAVTG